jgi:hypothetical protein
VFLYRRAFTRIQLPFRDYFMCLWPALSGVLGLTVSVLLVRGSLPADTPSIVRFIAQVAAGVAGYAVVLLTVHRKRVNQLRTVLANLRKPH